MSAMVERAIFAAVMILVAGTAWAGNDGVAHFPLGCAQWPSQTNAGTVITTPCTTIVGGSGGISTIDQVNKAKALVDDIAEKTKARDSLGSVKSEKVDVQVRRPDNYVTCPATYLSAPCSDGSVWVSISRQLIIDALQSQIDDDQQKLRAMGIRP